MTAALVGLVPRDALREALTRRRVPLPRHHEAVTTDEAERLLGGSLPAVPALRVPGGAEVVAVPRGAEPLRLRVAHLPAGTSWERGSVWSALLAGGSLLDVRADADGPRRVAGRGEPGTADSTVVTVDGVVFCVQADLSGPVLVSWDVVRGGAAVRLDLLTRRGPQAAVEVACGVR
ncbi:hypothetical protein [Kineococcus sp. NPDC059986]|uniref:hypothetical protein n=1 Tax=Kineococcus sp. NPDC059986 TaxID=3155538 RepID=UPI00344C4CA8